MRQARPKQPYHVISVDNTFFKNNDDCASNLASIRPSRRSGKATVIDIRAIQYLPSGEVLYKLNHSEPQWNELQVTWSTRQNVLHGQVAVAALYEHPPLISSAKYAHLQEMLTLIPADYHDFYGSLPHA